MCMKKTAERASIISNDQMLLTWQGSEHDMNIDGGYSNSAETVKTVFCDCGRPCEMNIPFKVKGSSIFSTRCNDCSKRIEDTEFIYHCPKGTNSKKHTNGFDLCSDCGEKRFVNKNNKIETTDKRIIDQDVEAIELKDDTKENIDDQVETTAEKEKSKRKRKKRKTRTNGKQVLLYSRLNDMADYGLKKQQNKLKSIIDEWENDRDWRKMINFEMHQAIPSSALRQDNGEYLSFPNTLGFDVKKLESLKMKDFYNVRVYLPRLIIVGKALDDKYHETMSDILKDDKNCEYMRGSLKRIERCQAKSESEFSLSENWFCSLFFLLIVVVCLVVMYWNSYSTQPFPQSAHLLDIVRCMVIYEKPKDLLAGIQTVMDKVKSDQTPLKRVLRVKNLYALIVFFLFVVYILARKKMFCLFFCCFFVLWWQF